MLPQSVWVELLDRPDTMCNRSRKGLSHMGAVYCGTGTFGHVWRIPLRGRSFEHVQAMCRSSLSRWQGPYRGSGVVLPASGAGTAPKRAPAARVAFRELERQGNAPLLLGQLFGLDKPALPVESPVYWPYSAERYLHLCKSFPQLGGLVNLIDRNLSRCQQEASAGVPTDYSVWLERAAILERWIDS